MPAIGSGGQRRAEQARRRLADPRRQQRQHGPTTIAAGTLQVGNGGAGVGFASPSVGGAGTMAFNVGNSFTYSGTLNNSGGLIKSGAGQLTWSSTDNALLGTIEVAAGTLNVGNGVSGNGVFNNGTGRTWQVDSARSEPDGTVVGNQRRQLRRQRRLAEPAPRDRQRQLFRLRQHDRRHDQRRLHGHRFRDRGREHQRVGRRLRHFIKLRHGLCRTTR